MAQVFSDLLNQMEVQDVLDSSLSQITPQESPQVVNYDPNLAISSQEKTRPRIVFKNGQ